MENKKATSTNNRLIIIIMSIAILVFISLYIWQHIKTKELSDYFEDEQTELENNFRSLIHEYDSLQIVNNYDSLFIQLDVEQQRVAQLLDELETVKARNAVKLREYRTELSTMRNVMKHYVVQIDSLNRANEVLLEENAYVKQQYKAATQTVVKLEVEKEKLSKTIAIASQLEVRQFEVDPQNDRGRSMHKVAKVERFVLSFSVIKNITSETGNKTIFLRITSPQLEVLASPDNGKFPFENGLLDYSEKKQFEYEAEDVNLEMYYAVNQFLFAGEYQFDLFIDGVHVGHQTLTLKD